MQGCLTNTFGSSASSWQMASETQVILFRWQACRDVSMERPARGASDRLLHPSHTSLRSPRMSPSIAGSDLAPCTAWMHWSLALHGRSDVIPRTSVCLMQAQMATFRIASLMSHQ